jgi:hypothetical protein
MVGKTDLSYTYAQTVRGDRPYNLFHGTVEVKPLSANTSKIVYTVVYDNSMLRDDAARERDKASQIVTYTRAIQNMKILAEGGTLSVSMDVDSLRAKGLQVGLQEAPGRIPVFYVPATKMRALAFQASLQAAVQWYEEQLNVSVPMTLFVLDAPARKILGVRDGAHSFWGRRPALIFMDEGRVQGNSTPGADPSHAVGGLLVDQALLFHEAGHVLAEGGLQLHFPNNGAASEFIAQLFGIAYVQAERRDLDFTPGRFVWARDETPRYTAWTDFESLPYDPREPSRYWFQVQLSRVAYDMMRNQTFASLIKGFQKEFPPGVAPPVHPDDIKAVLKRISPQLDLTDSLLGPTTITAARTITCEESKPTNRLSVLVVRNDRTDPITVRAVGQVPVPVSMFGRNDESITIGPRSKGWLARMGVIYRLPDGSCVTVRDEPTIAIVTP